MSVEFSGRPDDERRAIRDDFIRGYRSITPLDDRWIDDFSRVIQLRGLLMQLWSIEETGFDDSELNPHNEVVQWATNPVSW